MKITVNINGTDYEGNVEPVVSCEDKTETAKTGFERVEYNEDYYTILVRKNANWDVTEDGSGYDECCFTNGSYFNDENLASDYWRVLSLFLKLSRWQAEHDNQPDLKSGFYIKYNYEVGSFFVALEIENRGIFEIPFSTQEMAIDALGEFRSELEWFFTEFKPNLKWR